MYQLHSKHTISRRRVVRRNHDVVMRRHFSFSSLLFLIKRLCKIIASLSIVAIVFAVPYFVNIYLKNHEPIKFSDIKIYGNVTHISTAKLKTLVALAKNKNALTFDLQTYRQYWLNEPWINYVRIERQWPNRLSIYADVRTPVARWGNHEMIDKQGNIFMPDQLPAGQWVQLNGPKHFAIQLLEKLSIAQQKVQSLGLKVTMLSVDERAAYTVTLDNHLQLIIGTEDYDKRLSTFSMHYPQHIAAHVERIKSIDLRYYNGFAVKWRGSSSLIDIQHTARR